MTQIVPIISVLQDDAIAEVHAHSLEILAAVGVGCVSKIPYGGGHLPNKPFHLTPASLPAVARSDAGERPR